MPASLSARGRLFIPVDCAPYIGQTTPIAVKNSFSCPTDANCQWDLLSITFNPGTTAVADGSAVTVKFDKVTTAAGTTTAILVATSIVAGAFAADVPSMLFRGRISFNTAGDHLVATFATDGTLTTPAVGASLVYEIEITEYSGT